MAVRALSISKSKGKRVFFYRVKEEAGREKQNLWRGTWASKEK